MRSFAARIRDDAAAHRHERSAMRTRKRFSDDPIVRRLMRTMPAW
jgi:hypothetical protein